MLCFQGISTAYDPSYNGDKFFANMRGGGCSERAKGAKKASCGETVVQKCVCGEFVPSLPPLRFACLKHLKGPENLKGAEKKRILQKHPFQVLDDRFMTPSPLLWHAPSCRNCFQPNAKAFSSKRGLFFHGKGASRVSLCLNLRNSPLPLPRHPPRPSTPPPPPGRPPSS